MATYYECENGHLRTDYNQGDGTAPDRRCIECGEPAARCIE